MSGYFCRMALFAIGFTWLAAGHAQPQTADALTLGETIQRVTDNNPSLAAYAPRLKALAGERASASLSPPLALNAEADEFGGTNEAQGIDGVELTLALSSVIELGDRPALTVAQRRTRLLDVQAEAARLFVELAALQQELEVARQAQDLARQAEETVGRRVGRARAPQAELDRAKAATARASLEVGHIEHQLPTVRTKLAALWGAEQPGFQVVDDDALFHPGSTGAFEPLVEALNRNPDLQQLASQERIQTASLRLAQSNARAGVSIPLFSGRRAQGDIAAATARREAARFDSQAAVIAARATLFEAWQHRAHAIEAFAMLRDAVIPRLESALADTREAYRAGRYSYLELIAARQELIDARLALVNAARRAHLNRIELERLSGAALTAADSDSEHKESDHDH